MLFLNNCQDINHSEEYGDETCFYDIDISKKNHVENSISNQPLITRCVVASYASKAKDTIKFETWIRKSIKDHISKYSETAAFYGELKEVIKLPRTEAKKVFPQFFNTANDHFKQVSIIQG